MSAECSPKNGVSSQPIIASYTVIKNFNFKVFNFKLQLLNPRHKCSIKSAPITQQTGTKMMKLTGINLVFNPKQSKDDAFRGQHVAHGVIFKSHNMQIILIIFNNYII